MEDLTIIFITINKVPKRWAEYHRSVLLEAADGLPIITISREPVDIPGKHLSQKKYEISSANVTYQILRGARLAKTPYVAVAEDDTLYTKEHFRFYRPAPNFVGYNQHRWNLFTWGIPIYYYKQARGNCSMIGSRELVIKALEERFDKYPNWDHEKLGGEIGRHDIEKPLGVTVNNSDNVWSWEPIVSFRHDFSLEEAQRKHRKRPSIIRAYDIPVWRKAGNLVRYFR